MSVPHSEAGRRASQRLDDAAVEAALDTRGSRGSLDSDSKPEDPEQAPIVPAPERPQQHAALPPAKSRRISARTGSSEPGASTAAMERPRMAVRHSITAGFPQPHANGLALAQGLVDQSGSQRTILQNAHVSAKSSPVAAAAAAERAAQNASNQVQALHVKVLDLESQVTDGFDQIKEDMDDTNARFDRLEEMLRAALKADS